MSHTQIITVEKLTYTQRIPCTCMSSQSHTHATKNKMRAPLGSLRAPLGSLLTSLNVARERRSKWGRRKRRGRKKGRGEDREEEENDNEE